jgi:hypothetical protein
MAQGNQGSSNHYGISGDCRMQISDCTWDAWAVARLSNGGCGSNLHSAIFNSEIPFRATGFRRHLVVWNPLQKWPLPPSGSEKPA